LIPANKEITFDFMSLDSPSFRKKKLRIDRRMRSFLECTILKPFLLIVSKKGASEEYSLS
jgi:hypothetical protein